LANRNQWLKNIFIAILCVKMSRVTWASTGRSATQLHKDMFMNHRLDLTKETKNKTIFQTKVIALPSSSKPSKLTVG